MIKNKSNWNLFQDLSNKKPKNTINLWSIPEISKENLMVIWLKQEFNSKSSLSNWKESIAFINKHLLILMFINIKTICLEKNSMSWKDNSTKPKQTIKIKWVDLKLKLLSLDNNWPIIKLFKSKWMKQSWPWVK